MIGENGDLVGGGSGGKQLYRHSDGFAGEEIIDVDEGARVGFMGKFVDYTPLSLYTLVQGVEVDGVIVGVKGGAGPDAVRGGSRKVAVGGVIGKKDHHQGEEKNCGLHGVYC